MFYTIGKALPITKRVELIDKKEFTKTALDAHVEAYVMHVTSILTIEWYPAREIQIASLLIEQVKIPAVYSDYSDVFSEKNSLVILETNNLN